MMMLCATTWSQHRFMISTNAILLKILPTKKMTNRSTIGEPFGMTNNFISRFSKKNYCCPLKLQRA